MSVRVSSTVMDTVTSEVQLISRLLVSRLILRFSLQAEVPSFSFYFD